MRAFFRYFAMQQEITVLTLFLLGFFGGTHCAGMCGGLSSAFALHLPPHIGRVWLILLMNLGRISSYTLIGALMGALSQAGMLLDHTRTLQLVLFAAANLLLLMMGLYLSGISAAAGKIETLGKPVWRRLNPLLNRLLPIRSVPACFGIGLLWGWLPCGLVYNASLYALGSGSAPCPIFWQWAFSPAAYSVCCKTAVSAWPPACWSAHGRCGSWRFCGATTFRRNSDKKKAA